MQDKTAQIAELMKQRAEIDRQLAAIKAQMKAEIKTAFTVPKKPRKKETANG